MQARTWHVTINLSERDGHTHAEGVLHTDAGPDLRRDAAARRHPHDRDVPEIGAELATSRVLSLLAHDLLDASVSDIAGNTARARSTSPAAERVARHG